MKPRIGILSRVEIVLGVNAVLRAVVLADDKLGWEVVGFRDGFEGLLPPGNHLILDRQSVTNYQVRHVPIAEAVNRLKLVPSNGELVQTARDVISHSVIRFPSHHDHNGHTENPLQCFG